MKKVIKGFILLALILVSSSKLFAQVSIGLSINIAPPALPVYTQPACPVDGYLWVPGYWAYDNNAGDYFWVPGVWVSPPRPHYLWTPAYWGYDGNIYSFHAGYWGPHVGFYGGVNYGYGYGGSGFGGGRWVGNNFSYNTAVVNINRTVVKNTYIDNTVVVNNNTTINNRASFNGRGGVTATPRPEELAAMKERHVQPTTYQLSHQQAAMANRSQHASANHGKPAVTAYNKVNGDSFSQKGRPERAGAKNNADPQNAGMAKKPDALNQVQGRPNKTDQAKNEGNPPSDNFAKKPEAVNQGDARPNKMAVKNEATPQGENFARKPAPTNAPMARPERVAAPHREPVRVNRAPKPQMQRMAPAQHAERPHAKPPHER